MNTRYRHWLRIILWIFIAIYTLSLPHVIIIYRAIVSLFSPTISGIIPKGIIFIVGICYTVFGYLHKKDLRHIGYMIPCTVIVCAVLYIEQYPNKEIHIPEYIIMSWLLFMTLSIDYKGKGISILVSLCALLLGIVDELLQGIHPDRFYGWEDMGINAISSLIGVLLFEGLKNESQQGNWNWMIHLKKQKGLIIIAMLGVLGAAFQCIYLFKVKVSATFWSHYPLWLLGWNILFSASVLGLMFSFYRGHFVQWPNLKHSMAYSNEITAYLWVFIPSLILFFIHIIPLFVAIFGLEFG